jgi:hypothetical protein
LDRKIKTQLLLELGFALFININKKREENENKEGRNLKVPSHVCHLWYLRFCLCLLSPLLPLSLVFSIVTDLSKFIFGMNPSNFWFSIVMVILTYFFEKIVLFRVVISFSCTEFVVDKETFCCLLVEDFVHTEKAWL